MQSMSSAACRIITHVVHVVTATLNTTVLRLEARKYCRLVKTNQYEHYFERSSDSQKIIACYRRNDSACPLTAENCENPHVCQLCVHGHPKSRCPRMRKQRRHFLQKNGDRCIRRFPSFWLATSAALRRFLSTYLHVLFETREMIFTVY